MSKVRTRDVVVVAASAGGVEALQALLSRLPPSLPAAVLVVLHVPAAGGRALPRILARAGRLPADAATDGEEPAPGRVYVAPPDHHLLLIDGKLRLSRGPRHNGHRPAADALFVSAALSKGPQAIAVVLSGTLDDGAAGSAAVERRGGLVLVQDPAASLYEGMPRAAIAATRQARVLRLPELAAAIAQVAGEPLPDAPLQPDADLGRQISVFLGEDVPEPVPELVAYSGVTCPECGGPLRRKDTIPVRFDCPAGHAWSPESLLAAQASGIEQALWSAVLRLEERARLNRVLAATASRHHPARAGGFLSSARAAEASARQIRRLLTSAGAAGEPPPAAET